MLYPPLLGNPSPRTWDIFCHVVDNWGDLGVCWRLATQLTARGQKIRLWADDTAPLAWMAPHADAGIEVHTWPRTQPDAPPPQVPPGDVLIEAFGCDIQAAWVAALQPQAGVWINLEYLSAESYVERCHGLPSPVLNGPLAGRQKWFFYPGFTPQTGGLLGPGPLPTEAAPAPPPTARLDAPQIALFCYEPPGLPELLRQPDLAHAHWRVAAGRSQVAFAQARHHLPDTARSDDLPHLNQIAFDQLLQECDVNFVRGEDSLVRALWTGKPWVWHIYPQTDNAHHDKLEAFLDWLDAPPDWRDFHRVWNGLTNTPLPALRWRGWRDCAAAARQRLFTQRDLTSQLLSFVAEKQ
jgi:uncharacterized repeat protein (TIGR03837 family)